MEIWTESRETYGRPRIHAALAAGGVRVSRERVARLTRELGIKGVTRRRFRTGTTERDPDAAPARDLVKRDFSAQGPDRLWVADITQVPTGAGWAYLTVVLDAWSRRMGRLGDGYAHAGRAGQGRAGHGGPPPAAGGRGGPSLRQGLAVHVDGVREALPRGGHREVDGLVGDMYDNAMCESFFATLDCELIDRQRFRTRLEAPAGNLQLANFERLDHAA